MNAPVKINDSQVRRQAILDHSRCYLVEAGAGSGKTSVMAGHVVALLVASVSPRAIVAVTFTELAASELLERIERYAHQMANGEVPKDLEAAFDAPLSGEQLANLKAALPHLDEIVCTTIHGFCQRLIAPYPAEADIDPGATLLDRIEADALFDDTVDRWLHERLQIGGSALLAEMVTVDASAAHKTILSVAAALRRDPTATCQAPTDCAQAFGDFLTAAQVYEKAYRDGGVSEPDTEEDVLAMSETADRVRRALALPEPARTVALASMRFNSALLRADGKTFRALQTKTAYKKAAKEQGKQQTVAEAHYAGPIQNARGDCTQPFEEGRSIAALALLNLLVEEVREAIARFQQVKRERARLDFDDLIRSARRLLRTHPDVRRHLGERLKHILVDEFQDTDPVQAEICWLLAGDPPAGAGDNVPWDQFIPRPGALFFVGDPKQGIYRFRGADIAAYDRAKLALLAVDAGAVLQISSNFRSCKSVLDFVNRTFETPLKGPTQPGFHPLDHTIDDGSGLCVAALQINAPQGASADALRDAEATEVAKLCVSLIGNLDVRTKDGWRKCQPADIGLLAPAGTDLWRYEQQLEDLNIPVSTQAGKGFFWRQEVQDVIAFCRAVSDRRDTIALAAFLRGPMVGLTERELLEIAEATEGKKLRLGVDYSQLADGYAKTVMANLEMLSRKARSMTPYEVLSSGVDLFKMRSTLLRRHGAQAERGLANLDSFLEQSRAWGTRGLKAFANMMAAAWDDDERQGEGRPDAQEQAVSLFTMHSAKGLEWPVVIVVNSCSETKPESGPVLLRSNGRVELSCSVLGTAPMGYSAALQAEQQAVDDERVRVWYVGATRAKELLVLPRHTEPKGWASIVTFDLTDREDIPVGDPGKLIIDTSVSPNAQTDDIFRDEASRVERATRNVTFLAPSRSEGEAPDDDDLSGVVTDDEDEATEALAPVGPEDEAVQGGLHRGQVMHKLFEEVLTGETTETPEALTSRADELLRELGSPTGRFSPAEIAGCVIRGFQVPEVAAVRQRLRPEWTVYALDQEADRDAVTFGIADALAQAEDGSIDLVVDWKSDVAPDDATKTSYVEQVRAYLKATTAKKGLIVFPTGGAVIHVA